MSCGHVRRNRVRLYHGTVAVHLPASRQVCQAHAEGRRIHVKLVSGLGAVLRLLVLLGVHGFLVEDKFKLEGLVQVGLQDFGLGFRLRAQGISPKSKSCQNKQRHKFNTQQLSSAILELATPPIQRCHEGGPEVFIAEEQPGFQSRNRLTMAAWMKFESLCMQAATGFA